MFQKRDFVRDRMLSMANFALFCSYRNFIIHFSSLLSEAAEAIVQRIFQKAL